MSLRKSLTTRSIQRVAKGEYEGGGFHVSVAKIDGRNMIAVEVDGATYSWETFDLDTFDEQRARVAAEVGFRSHFGLQSTGPADYGQQALAVLRRKREERVA